MEVEGEPIRGWELVEGYGRQLMVEELRACGQVRSRVEFFEEVEEVQVSQPAHAWGAQHGRICQHQAEAEEH